MTHYNPEQLASFPWIVSSHTMRPCDLAAAYLGALDSLGAQLGEFDRAELAQLASHAADTVGPDATDAAWLALNNAELLLGDLAPCGFYFGASEGDGACFGFWLTEDWQEAMEHLGLDGDDPAGWASLISELALDGIEPETIEDSYVGRAEGWSEERAGTNYAEQLAEDLGLELDRMQWPLTCVDWEAAWRELQLGDGYRLHNLGNYVWLVFRSV
jgi:hypothetical protein